MSRLSSFPLFVVGIGRSGTSLLQSMIASHDVISMPPETSFFRRYVVPGTLETNIKNSGVETARELLVADKHLRRLGVDVPMLFDEVVSSSCDSIDASLYLSLLRTCAEQSGKTLIADKEPRAIENLPLIHRLWPESKILHIYRDPRDVLVSKKKAAWSKSGTTLRHVLVGRIQWRMSQSFARGIGEDMYRAVKYEDILSDPGEELRSICRWLGIEFQQQMLEFSGAASVLISRDEYSWKKETTGPLLKDNFGKWRSELSWFETALVEQTNEDIMRYGGYSKSRSGTVARLFCLPASMLVKAAAALYAISKGYRLAY